jgi:hypothetical protein
MPHQRKAPWLVLAFIVAPFVALTLSCGSDRSLYEDQPATTEPRCGEANDERCEP